MRWLQICDRCGLFFFPCYYSYYLIFLTFLLENFEIYNRCTDTLLTLTQGPRITEREREREKWAASFFICLHRLCVVAPKAMTVESVEAVEVKAEDTQMTEVSVSLPEEEKAVEKVNEAKPKTVEKSSSYREESNFLSDLKDNENKALIELRSKLEEAILRNTLFKKEELKKETASESKEEQPAAAEKKEKEPEATDGAAPEEAEPKTEGEDKQSSSEVEKPEEVVDRDITLWGVPLLPSKCAEGNDVILLKFLRAREFKVNEAFEMLKKTLEWRKEFKTDSILEEELGQDISSVAYMNGVDREGHPICYNIYGVLENQELYQKTFGTEEKRNQFLRWRIQLMEKGIQKLDFKPGGVTSLLQINDLSNSPGPSKKEIRIATKQAVGLLQDNYPEFVARNVRFTHTQTATFS